MTSTINASSTGSGGIVQTADASGVLALQANGTTAFTVNSDATTTFASAANLPNTFGFKNRIINGGMVIDQRNAGASVTFNDAVFTVDRFGSACSQSSKATSTQSSTAPTGFSYSALITSSSAYTLLAGDFFNIYQNIEGFNTADLAWGTASASSITLSFWVRSSLTGTFGGSISNSALSRSYPFTYTISVANTFEQKTITIAGDTTGTWVGATNGIGLRVYFGLGVGTTYSGTAGAWAATRYQSATGATSVVSTNGATFYITGVQLEKGSTATSFDFRSYGTELALCQRYLPAFIGLNNALFGFFYSTTNAYVGCTFPVTARVAPTGATFSNAGDFTIGDIVSVSNVATSASFSSAGTNTSQLIFVTAAVLTAQRAGFVIGNSSASKILFTGCEL